PGAFDVYALSRHAATRMPDYMVPAHIVPLAALPLDPNGKIDRQALPDPLAAGSPERTQAYIAPRDEVERRLAAIWEALLDLRPIGIRDNFFSLGGHSLKVAQLVSRIKREFRFDMPLTAVFQSPTIEGIAAM